jgi:hypothetical protein
MAVFTTLTPPIANLVWSGLTGATMAAAQRTRKIYTGDGQTYNLYMLYYFLLLYVSGGGLGTLLAFRF